MRGEGSPSTQVTTREPTSSRESREAQHLASLRNGVLPFGARPRKACAWLRVVLYPHEMRVTARQGESCDAAARPFPRTASVHV